MRIAFTKGHGTGNDFVLVADPDGAVDLAAAEASRLADRHLGVGGDGVIRAVRSRSLPEGEAALADDPGAEWFMDYRNADGSAAEMCGNGIRVLGQFLLAEGLASPSAGESLRIGTRGGVRTLTRTPDGWSVDLGAFAVDDGGVTVTARGLDIDRPGLAVDLGNPHIVVALAGDGELDGIDLSVAPGVAPMPTHGANVEFVVPRDPLVVAGEGRIRMRVHERGVGETLSCGTGAAAAAIATRWWAGAGAPDAWRVEVPGGVLGVRVRGDRAELSGPAELVYSGSVEL